MQSIRVMRSMRSVRVFNASSTLKMNRDQRLVVSGHAKYAVFTPLPPNQIMQKSNKLILRMQSVRGMRSVRSLRVFNGSYTLKMNRDQRPALSGYARYAVFGPPPPPDLILQK